MFVCVREREVRGKNQVVEFSYGEQSKFLITALSI